MEVLMWLTLGGCAIVVLWCISKLLPQPKENPHYDRNSNATIDPNAAFREARHWAESGQAYAENKAFEAKIERLERANRANIFFEKRERPDGFHRKFVEHEPVAGASHYQPAYEKLYAAKNAQITLLAEPDNKFDPNAIAVKADIGSEELHLGYLSRKLANRFSQQVPSHVPTFARLTTIIPPNNGMHGGARIEIWLPRRDLWDKYK